MKLEHVQEGLLSFFIMFPIIQHGEMDFSSRPTWPRPILPLKAMSKKEKQAHLLLLLRGRRV
jgi:hypothetical protein